MDKKLDKKKIAVISISIIAIIAVIVAVVFSISSNNSSKSNKDANKKQSTSSVSQSTTKEESTLPLDADVDKETTTKKVVKKKPTTQKAPQTTKQQATEPAVTMDPNRTKTCYIEIRCDTVLYNLDNLEPSKEAIIPKDGTILKKVPIKYKDGDNGFDILKYASQEYGFSIEGSSNYIEGINGLYQFNCGGLSGWMYFVNGAYINRGCGSYVVNENDFFCWQYTCDSGRDLM